MWLKEFLFKRQFNRQIAEQKSDTSPQIKNNQIQKIGILHDLTNSEDIEDIHRYQAYLSKKSKIVDVYSFVAQKEVHESSFCFTKADLNWYEYPTSDKIQSFLTAEFDLLITLNRNQSKLISSLNALSKAKFKIGLSPDSVDYYHMLIEATKPENLRSVFTEIDLTLHKLAIH